jgi:hypothetical protein
LTSPMLGFRNVPASPWISVAPSIDELDDVRMIEGRERPSLLHEACGVGRAVEHLHRDAAPELEMERLVDGAHPASPDGAQDLVTSLEALADLHRCR